MNYYQTGFQETTYTVSALLAFTGEAPRPWTKKVRAHTVDQAKDEFIRQVRKAFGPHMMISNIRVYDNSNYEIIDATK